MEELVSYYNQYCSINENYSTNGFIPETLEEELELLKRKTFDLQQEYNALQSKESDLNEEEQKRYNALKEYFAAGDNNLCDCVCKLCDDVKKVEPEPKPEDPTPAKKPKVTTKKATDVKSTSATCGGNVTDENGATVTERGVCWGTEENPTTSGNHEKKGKGKGEFSVELKDLKAETKYFVRAYAKNSVGTSYGKNEEFTTEKEQKPNPENPENPNQTNPENPNQTNPENPNQTNPNNQDKPKPNENPNPLGNELAATLGNWLIDQNKISYLEDRYRKVTLEEVTAPTKTGETAIHQMESLDMAKLIGAPLTAAVEANFDAARKMLSCVQDIGIKDNTLTSVTFTFFKNGRRCNMTIPLLTLVPINSMTIKEMKYDFKLKIDTSSSVNLVQGSQQALGYNTQVPELNPSTRATEEPANPGGAKPQTGGGDKPQTGGGDKPQTGGGDKPQAEGGDKPQAEGGNKPQAEGGNKPQAEGGNKPETNGGTKPQTGGTNAGTGTKAATQATAKDTVKVDKTFGVSYSSKRDSSSTQSSKYSVETSMDVKLTIGPDSMPGGISKLLEILNETIEVYNPDGELTVSASQVQLMNGYATVTAVYYDTSGALALGKISCKKTEGEGEGKVDISPTGNYLQMTFNEPGKYTITAEKLKFNVFVAPEPQKAE